MIRLQHLNLLDAVAGGVEVSADNALRVNPVLHRNQAVVVVIQPVDPHQDGVFRIGQRPRFPARRVDAVEAHAVIGDIQHAVCRTNSDALGRDPRRLLQQFRQGIIFRADDVKPGRKTVGNEHVAGGVEDQIAEEMCTAIRGKQITLQQLSGTPVVFEDAGKIRFRLAVAGDLRYYPATSP